MSSWAEVAERIAGAFEVGAGGFVLVRDRCGRPEVVDEVVIAFEKRGVTVLIDAASDYILGRVLTEADPAVLDSWGTHRSAALELADGIVSLGGGPLPEVPRAALGKLAQGRAEMEAVESRRRLPFLSVAVPTAHLARDLGQDLTSLDAAVIAAITLPREVINGHIATERLRLSSDTLILRTEGCTLTMSRRGRAWLADDGHISAADRRAGAVVSNLPCGSLYTTVVEDSAKGAVLVPELAGARDVVLHFEAGRVVATEPASVLEWLSSWDDGARRISHVGIAVHPSCPGDTGWTIVDEHRAGTVFLALGENRYMGGRTASLLNHDIALANARLIADGADVVTGE